jgi:hypothetical protein
MSCEYRAKKDKRRCGQPPKWWLTIATVPQPIPAPAGRPGEMESEPAGRSITVCGRHLNAALCGLYSLPYRKPGAVAQVSPAPGPLNR